MNPPQSNLKIRPAILGDQKFIHTLLSSFKLPLDGLEGTKLWVLQSGNGGILGVAGLEVYGGQGLLRSVAVVNSRHSQGYGTEIVNHVIGEAKKMDIKDLFLLTTTAPEFFKKFGFKQESREKVGGGIADSVEFQSACPKTAVLMRLTLS